MSKKLKIAIIGSRGYPYVYSGYETLVKELSERLVKNGHQVRVYCHRSLFNNRPKNVNGIELTYTPSIETKLLSQFVNSFFSFLHVCFTNSEIVFVVNAANGPFGILTRIFKKKTCINVDGLEWLRPKWKGLGGIYFKFSARLATKLYDKIITDSIEMSNIYTKEFKVNSDVICYGSGDKSLNNSILKKLKILKEEFYLVVGRLIPDNNVDFIIKEFIKSKTSKKLVIVGDSPYRDEFSIQIKKNKDKRIIFTGYVNNQSDLNSLFKNSYAYIHGHEYGGTNPTMVKALSFSCAMIALETKFNHEMLSDIRIKFFFKKKTNSLKKLINLCDSDPLIIKQMKLQKSLKLKSVYNWNYISNQYIQLFESLLKK